jgi:hypothetical protein
MTLKDKPDATKGAARIRTSHCRLLHPLWAAFTRGLPLLCVGHPIRLGPPPLPG